MTHRALAALVVGTCVAGCDPAPTPDPVPAAPAAEASAAAEATGGVAMPAGLSGEERALWSTLTPEAQAQAAAFIAAGGTLTGFLAV
ncbi:MAG: hypothetical protein AAFV62_11965 [Pseudomonadota bacterium]